MKELFVCYRAYVTRESDDKDYSYERQVIVVIESMKNLSVALINFECSEADYLKVQNIKVQDIVYLGPAGPDDMPIVTEIQ